MSRRKYLGLFALIVTLVVVIATPAGMVGATVYTPPTPIPEQRFSESSDKLLAMARQPGDIVVLGASGSSEFVKAEGITDADMDKAILARVERANTGSSYEGGRKVLAKSLPRSLTFKDLRKELELNGVYLSDDMVARIERSGQGREVLYEMLDAVLNPDQPAVTYVDSDNTWFLGCRDNGDCYQ